LNFLAFVNSFFIKMSKKKVKDNGNKKIEIKLNFLSQKLGLINII